MLQVPQPHKKGVTCISGIMISETDAVFASTSSDGAVYVWELILPSSSGGEWSQFVCLSILILISVWGLNIYLTCTYLNSLFISFVGLFDVIMVSTCLSVTSWDQFVMRIRLTCLVYSLSVIVWPNCGFGTFVLEQVVLKLIVLNFFYLFCPTLWLMVLSDQDFFV